MSVLPSIQKVTSARIPMEAMRHRHVVETTMCLHVMDRNEHTKETVIGTANTQRAELYGWINPVPAHVDDDDVPVMWMYGLLLKGACHIITNDSKVYIRPGDVFRLNDRVLHWTKGHGVSVCVFTGCFPEPRDEWAAQLLERGLRKLGNGVRSAPRSREGFRVRHPDEVYATGDFKSLSLVSRETAERWDMHIAECHKCGAPADTVDCHFPYFAEHWCRDCGKAEAAA